MLQALDGPLKTDESEQRFDSGMTIKNRKNDYYHHLKKIATNS
jgi:hypothetical protein